MNAFSSYIIGLYVFIIYPLFSSYP